METDKKISVKTKLWIIGITLLLLLVFGIIIYRSGRKKGSINLSSPVIDNPNNPGGNTTPVTATADIMALTDLVHRDMEGVNLEHDTDLWSNRVLTLSDTDFVRLYNEFNSKYQKDSGETFTQWIAGETAYYVPLLGTQWGTIKDSLLTRLSKLNLI